jgi:circadian clock protein KaiC
MSQQNARVSTGVAGLDEVLRGGVMPRRSYMVRGGPGTGKTILGLHFLTCPSPDDEKVLFVTFGESEAEIRRNAELLGFDLSAVSFLDLSPSANQFLENQNYDIFPPSEVERDPIMEQIKESVAAIQPGRVFVDGMTQFRHLTASGFHFRKESLSFLRFLNECGATVLFTSESNETPDDDLQFIADGVIQLEFNSGQRRLEVVKFRGSDFRAGTHTLRLCDQGMRIFPRLLPEEFSVDFEPEKISFGLEELDRMVHGGIERGTITILTGPSGVGKTTLGMQFVRAAAARGERSVVYLFEEWVGTLMRRCESVHIPVGNMVDSGMLSVVHVEPLRFTADEFALMVREEVEKRKARIVMIDSIAGYRLSLRDQDLVKHLHALSKYLQNMGVAVVLINEIEAINGEFRVTDVGISYIADNILFLRYLELRGEMAKALGVLKKRLSDFEKTLREMSITPRGIVIGQPLHGLRGVLGVVEGHGPDE